MSPWIPNPYLGVPPRTRCASMPAESPATGQFLLVVAVMLVLLAVHYPIAVALTVPLVALLGVRIVTTARISTAVTAIRRLLGPQGATAGSGDDIVPSWS